MYVIEAQAGANANPKYKLKSNLDPKSKSCSKCDPTLITIYT